MNKKGLFAKLLACVSVVVVLGFVAACTIDVTVKTKKGIIYVWNDVNPALVDASIPLSQIEPRTLELRYWKTNNTVDGGLQDLSSNPLRYGQGAGWEVSSEDSFGDLWQYKVRVNDGYKDYFTTEAISVEDGDTVDVYYEPTWNAAGTMSCVLTVETSRNKSRSVRKSVRAKTFNPDKAPIVIKLPDTEGK